MTEKPNNTVGIVEDLLPRSKELLAFKGRNWEIIAPHTISDIHHAAKNTTLRFRNVFQKLAETTIKVQSDPNNPILTGIHSRLRAERGGSLVTEVSAADNRIKPVFFQDGNICIIPVHYDDRNLIPEKRTGYFLSMPFTGSPAPGFIQWRGMFEFMAKKENSGDIAAAYKITEAEIARAAKRYAPIALRRPDERITETDIHRLLKGEMTESNKILLDMLEKGEMDIKGGYFKEARQILDRIQQFADYLNSFKNSRLEPYLTLAKASQFHSVLFRASLMYP